MKLINRLISMVFATLMGIHMVANAQQSEVELIEPGPISFPGSASYTLNEARKAILSAAMRHDWRVESEAPGTARIVLDERTDRAVLVMDVVYDVKSYSIKYVSSENLRYVEGKKPAVQHAKANYASRFEQSSPVSRFDQPSPAKIHPSFSRWMKNLVNSIDVELRIVKL